MSDTDTGVLERLIVALNANTAALTGKVADAPAKPVAAKPAAKPAAPKASKHTLETVVAKAGELAKARGVPAAKSLAESFGAARSRELKPDTWDAFMDAADAVIAGEEAATGDDDDV